MGVPFSVTQFGSWQLTFLQVKGSDTGGPHNAVLVGAETAMGGFEEGDVETATDVEAFGGPGVVFRPRPPYDVGAPADGAGAGTGARQSETIAAEAIGARTADGIVPLAWRDLRFNRVFPAPKPGTVALVGYGGGFLAFDDVGGDLTRQPSALLPMSLATLYVPYAFSGDTPGKAHAIVVDPDEEAISIIHGEGQSVLLQDDGSIMLQSKTGASYVQITDAGVTIQAPQLVLNGGAVVVGNPIGAIVPLTAGAASPPCPRLFVNPAA